MRELEGLRPAEATDPAGVAQVVVDRVKVATGAESRLAAALEEAWARGGGTGRRPRARRPGRGRAGGGRRS